ncbi:MAG TPA: flagellar export chaperone FliS [Candidatus Acidoferrum sp.]|nr:flagellar export chaperone FliS [Candidatus Acidoferrum sp.]
MRDRDAISAYHNAAAAGSTPVGLVVALYETILRDFRRALEALASGKVESRIFEMNHALTVIAHLQGTLDFSRGQDAAKTFDRFYNVTRAMIVDANAKADRNSILQLIEMYSSLRQAWQEVDRKSAAVGQPAPPGSPAPVVFPAAPALDPTERPSHTTRWSA